MAESPRTAQNVDYIMNYAEDIRYDLNSLVEKLDDAEVRNTQREMITAISRLTTTIENLHATYLSMQHERVVSSAGSNGGPQPGPAPVAPAA